MEFKDTLKSTQLIVSPEIDVRIHSITNLIIEALKSSDKNVTKNLKKCIPWWTPTLSYLRKEKKNHLKDSPDHQPLKTEKSSMNAKGNFEMKSKNKKN